MSAARQSNTGTPKGIDHWVRQQRPSDEDEARLELWCLAMEGASCVATWPWQEVRTDGIAWAERVSETATHDADGRGRGSRYELRLVCGDRTTTMTHLYRAVAVRAEDEGSTPIDGSRDSLVVALMRSLERSTSQVIEMSRVAMDGQRHAMLLLAQSFEHNRALMASNLEQHASKLEAEEAAARVLNQGAPKSEAFDQMLKLAMPMLVAHLQGQGGGTPPEH
jgi:hypothetical protein